MKTTQMTAALPLLAVSFSLLAQDFNQPNATESWQRVNIETAVQHSQEKPSQLAVEDLPESDDPALAMAQMIFIKINQQDWQEVRRLLATYQQQQNQDITIILFAKAKLAEVDGHYSLAKKHYQELLRYLPDFTRGQLELARLLFLDSQDKQAQQLFTALMQNDSIPSSVKNQIQPFLNAIDKRNQWQVNASVGTGYESNINQVSSLKNCFHIPIIGQTICQESAPKISDGFYNYQLNASRFYALKPNSGIEIKALALGKHYKHKTDYNHHMVNLAVGYAFKNAKYQFNLSPNIEYKWSGEKPEYQAYGISADANIRLKPNWNMGIYASYQQQKNQSNALLHNKNYFLSSYQVYTPSPNLALIASVDWLKKDYPDAPLASYQRQGLRLGMIGQTPYQTHLAINAHQRYYQHSTPALIYGSQDKLKKRETILATELSNNRLTFWGAKPVLYFNYTKVNSNIPIYFSYKSKEFGLKINKIF